MRKPTLVMQTCTKCRKTFHGHNRTDLCPECRKRKALDRWTEKYKQGKTKVCGIDGCKAMIFPDQLGCKKHAPSERKRLGIGKADGDETCHDEDIRFEAAITAQKILQKAGMTRNMVAVALRDLTGEKKPFRLCSREELERRKAMHEEQQARMKKKKGTKNEN